MAKRKSLRARTTIEQSAFVKGLITEASPLTFPENASLDEENFFLNRDGSRQRRLGLDYEVGYTLQAISKEDTVLADVDTTIWQDASNNRSLRIAVVRTGSQFYFYEGDADVVSSSPMQVEDLNGNILERGKPLVIPSLSINGIDLNFKYDYTFAHGYLIITSGLQEFYIITYDVQNDLISARRRRIKVRDHFGVTESTLGVNDFFDFRQAVGDITDPLDLDLQHRYNLRNQGWLEQLDCASYGDPLVSPVVPVLVPDADTIRFTGSEIGFYPSNADTVWAHKVSEGASDPGTIGAYAPAELKKSTVGRARAVKGRYILDLFNRGEERKRLMQSENPTYPIIEIPLDRTIGGLTACQSYVGRIVFAVNEIEVQEGDTNSPSLGSMILFSKATDNVAEMNAFYADSDPTSGEAFASLATDGGFFTITGLGHVNSMEVMGNSLFVFSDRGVWQVNGGDRLFSATNINSTQASEVGSIGKNSTVIAENNVFYLSDAGIYVLPIGQESKSSLPVNITQSTIQTFWESIPEANKEFIVASYDKFARQVKWLIRMGKTPNRNFYDTELIYDLNLEAFFVYKIREIDATLGSPYVVGFLERSNIVQAVSDLQIYAGIDSVQDGVFPNNEAVVVKLRETSEDFITSNKYWVIEERPNDANSALTVAEYRNVLFRDWGELQDINGESGVDADAFLLTGYATAGEASVFKRVSTITTFMRLTDKQLFKAEDGFISDNPSSCILQAQWEWTNRPESGRWSNPQQAYKLPRTFVPDEEDFPYGHTVVSSKLNMRGKGRALSLLFKTEPYKDCHLYGWSLAVNAENNE